MPRALLSVSDKTGLVELASGLVSQGWELVSTGGTARTIADAGLPVTNVAEVTGVPEMMDGRVKTLHPTIHGGILARRARPDDLEAARREGITLIDLVAVNLYPFARAAADPTTTFDALVEEIDIGGPSLVRAAAKSFRDVLVLVDPRDYAEVLTHAADLAAIPLAFRFDLARKAFAHTAEYDDRIARALDGVQVEGQHITRGASAADRSAAISPPDTTAAARPPAPPPDLPEELTLSGRLVRTLRYGENPHQRAAWYARPKGHGLGAVEVHQGKELSFTNLLDLDAAARIVLELDEAAAAVIKHTNPCGVAIGASVADAYVRARDADALSAFGGVVGLNRTIDEAAASAIVSTFIEAVVAPAVTPAALEILARKPKLRVVTATLADPHETAGLLEARSILGAWLVQERDRVTEAHRPWPAETGVRVVTARAPRDDEWRALRFAWRVCAHVKSNAVIFTGPDRTLAIGAGQMSRVDAVKVAVMKATASLTGSVVASDAFFPFRDGVDAVAEAGASAVVQPGGSVRDAEVIAAAEEHGLAMVFTGRRHFRH